MPFKLEITANDATEFAQQIVTLAFMVAPDMKNRLSASTAPVQQDSVVEEVAEPRKARKAKKNETIIEGEVVDAPESNRVDGAGRDESTDSAGQFADGAGVPAEGDAAATVPAEEQPSEPVADTPAEETAPEPDVAKNDEPCMTIDELRKYTISNYLNACFAAQDQRSLAFKMLLAHFGKEKMVDVAPEEINAVKAEVDKRISQETEVRAGSRDRSTALGISRN